MVTPSIDKSSDVPIEVNVDRNRKRDHDVEKGDF